MRFFANLLLQGVDDHAGKRAREEMLPQRIFEGRNRREHSTAAEMHQHRAALDLCNRGGGGPRKRRWTEQPHTIRAEKQRKTLTSNLLIHPRAGVCAA